MTVVTNRDQIINGISDKENIDNSNKVKLAYQTNDINSNI